jgi:putative Mn2+ efflux pump MntP
MVLVTVIIIAVGLAMDTFAVSIVSGAAYKRLNIKYALRMALFFGGFQALMPAIGALAGMGVEKYIADYDHWVAFALLIIIGCKMIYESFKIKPSNENFDPSNLPVVLVLSIATSIDALAIGITLPLLKMPVAAAVVIIGIVTFIISYLGSLIGKKIGHFFENKIEAVGGLILIALGAKILFEHIL